MGVVREPDLVKPVCGVTFAEGVEIEEVIRQIEKILGTVEDQTSIFHFSFTDYYAREMGADLRKVFVSFVKSIHPGLLPEIKRKTNAMEEAWSVEGKRRVNIDPGYITGAKLVLASTKDFAHRVYLADGIYGDVQLQFRQNRFHPERWTYPDYRMDEALAFFQRVREKFVREGKRHAEEDEL